MNRVFLLCVLGFGAALTAFAVTRHWHGCRCATSQPRPDAAPQALMPELRWLGQELDLHPEQLAAVEALHLAHLPACEDLCRRIESCRHGVMTRVAQGDTDSPAFSEALEELAAVETECRQVLYRHVCRTAAGLSPDQARAYFRIVFPSFPGDTGTDSADRHSGTSP